MSRARDRLYTAAFADMARREAGRKAKTKAFREAQAELETAAKHILAPFDIRGADDAIAALRAALAKLEANR